MPGASERGIDSIWQIADGCITGTQPSDTADTTHFRDRAQKVFLIITDEDSDDMGRDEAGDGYAVADYVKQQLYTKLDATYGAGEAQIWSVANMEGVWGGAPGAGTITTDSDYLDLVSQTGGNSFDLPTDPPLVCPARHG